MNQAKKHATDVLKVSILCLIASGIIVAVLAQWLHIIKIESLFDNFNL